MRPGGSTVVQQSLTPEASAMVKSAVSLARRRGHAQVTPLHVATAMLSVPTGLLRSACLQSHSQSHPLRCKALDLCFNVALNRLPSSSQILMGPYRAHHQSPSLSNALVAAFKRAQAHQRRGSSTDAHQQPVVVVRIDVEQLIISILDDPSVSRVMREAGFSSTQVKANLEKAFPLEMAAPPKTHPPNTSKTVQGGSSRNEDVMSVVETMIGRQKRSIVIVGESLASAKGIVGSFMDVAQKGEVHADLKSLQFIALPLLSFEKMLREEVEKKLDELRCLVRSCGAGKGVVLYLGDLKWAADYWASCEGSRRSLYCAIDSVVKEIGKLVRSGDDFWLMAIATHQTYLQCRVGNPSLETVWGLQPLTVPAVSLDLRLNYDSNPCTQLRPERSNEDGSCWPLLQDGIRNDLTSVVSPPSVANSDHRESVLPPWLLQSREESRRATVSHMVVPGYVKDQCKWSSISNSDGGHQHQYPFEKTLDFSSVSPSSSSPFGSQQTHQTRQASSRNPKSTSSTETVEVEYLPKFKEINAENLKTLCNSLESVSSHNEMIPKIASTVLQCRSGMIRRKDKSGLNGLKEETWLLFLGSDNEGKEKIARGLATLVFGSPTNLISIGFSEFSSSSDLGSKRSRTGASIVYTERLAGAIQDNPHRVFVLEDVESIEHYSQISLLNAIRTGMIRSSAGENVTVGDAIFILSCENLDSRSKACSYPIKRRFNGDEEEKEAACEGFDLNLHAESGDDDCSSTDVGILEAVDSTFFFRCPDES